MNKIPLITFAITGIILLISPLPCAAKKMQVAPGWNFKLGLYAHGGVSQVDYSDSSQLSAEKDKINDSPPIYHTGNISIDSIYAWQSSMSGNLQITLHTQLQLEDPWLDNDRIDELSLELKSRRFGAWYLGEDDGAAQQLKPVQAGRVGIAIGHSGPRGIIPWWGNLPYVGGAGRNHLFDWSDGIVSGNWRSFERHTQDTIKTGYISPQINSWTFGVSVNLQDTYAGYEGKGTAPSQNDNWDNIGFKKDEYELAAQWHKDTTQGWILDGGITRVSVHTVNADVLQENNSGGVRVGKKLAKFGIVGVGVLYAAQKYSSDSRDNETGRQMHLGFDWSKQKWKFGVNYYKSWEAWNSVYTRKLGGSGNRGASVGVDYRIIKQGTLSIGIIDASNDEGEEAVELGMNFTFHSSLLLN